MERTDEAVESGVFRAVGDPEVLNARMLRRFRFDTRKRHADYPAY
jgi:hypothetical protein